MMLSTGIPELQSHDDVAYLQTTLCLDMEEDEAGRAFLKEIDLALKDSWVSATAQKQPVRNTQ